MTAKPNRLNRRTLLRCGAGLATLGLGGGGYLSVFGERHRPVVRHVSVPLRGLPDDLDGLRIGHLSDLHRGRWVTQAFIRRAAERLMGLEPDLIAVTGDFISGDSKLSGSVSEALQGLTAPLGVFGCLGNHDITAGEPETLIRDLAGAGLRVLRNESAAVTRGTADLWLCGVDDARRGRPDLEATLAGVPRDAFRIVLCHEPDFADETTPHAIPLQLSGHSHGGQVVFPVAGRLITPPGGTKYPAGLQRVDGTPGRVYTNVGLGVIGLPLRLNCPPEITLLTLSAV